MWHKRMCYNLGLDWNRTQKYVRLGTYHTLLQKSFSDKLPIVYCSSHMRT